MNYEDTKSPRAAKTAPLCLRAFVVERICGRFMEEREGSTPCQYSIVFATVSHRLLITFHILHFNPMKTCLLLPAYNESQTIGRIIQEANLFVGRVVVIDDGSLDKTADIADVNGVVVLRHSRNRGKGMALRTGFDYALKNEYELIVTMDSDGQHDPFDLPRFFDYFRWRHPDILIGERLEERSAMPLHRRLNNSLVSAVGTALAGQTVPDFQSGYRLIQAKVLKAVCLETERYETESEILIQAGQRGFRIESLPIRAIYGNEVSNVKPLREMWLFSRLLVKSLRTL